MTELRRPERLAKHHNRRNFACGEPELDEWLRTYAGRSRRSNSAATTVIADPTNAVVGYVALSVGGVDRSAAPAALAKGAPTMVPGLLIGRLAVDTDVTGEGVGTTLVRHALRVAVAINESAGCTAVLVNAYSAVSRGWWERLGFIPFADDSLDLYLPTSVIARTIGT